MQCILLKIAKKNLHKSKTKRKELLHTHALHYTFIQKESSLSTYLHFTLKCSNHNHIQLVNFYGHFFQTEGESDSGAVVVFLFLVFCFYVWQWTTDDCEKTKTTDSNFAHSLVFCKSTKMSFCFSYTFFILYLTVRTFQVASKHNTYKE